MEITKEGILIGLGQKQDTLLSIPRGGRCRIGFGTVALTPVHTVEHCQADGRSGTGSGKQNVVCTAQELGQVMGTGLPALTAAHAQRAQTKARQVLLPGQIRARAPGGTLDLGQCPQDSLRPQVGSPAVQMDPVKGKIEPPALSNVVGPRFAHSPSIRPGKQPLTWKVAGTAGEECQLFDGCLPDIGHWHLSGGCDMLDHTIETGRTTIDR